MGDTVVNKGEREDKTADDVYFLCEHAIQTWLFLFVLRVCVCVCVRACMCACMCACVRACVLCEYVLFYLFFSFSSAEHFSVIS